MEVWKPLLTSVRHQLHLPGRQEGGQHREQTRAWKNSLNSAIHLLENCLVVPSHVKRMEKRKIRLSPPMPVRSEA